jgi:hypothetical protein
MGLSNIRERVDTLGGTVAVWSLPGKGTTLHLCIPLARPQSQVQAQELTNEKLAPVVAKTRSIFRAGILAAELAAALILLYTPAFIAVWAVLICIIVAFGSWLWTQQHRRRISLEFGREHPVNFVLLAESYGLLSGILLLCMLWPNYLTHLSDVLYSAFAAAQFTPDTFWIAWTPWSVWLASGFFGIFTIAIAATYVRYAQNISRYYKTLSSKEAQEQVRRQLQQLVIDWMAWTIVAALTVFLLNFFPAILVGPAEPAVQSMDLILLCAWFIIILLKSVRIAREHSALRRSAKLATLEEKGGGS